MPASSPSVCIVSSDIVGPIRNGGIGTAYTALAFALARSGCAVTVLYALGRHCEQGTLAQWQRYYARHGIEFVALPDPPAPRLSAPPEAQHAYAVYRWLKDRHFDVVHFHEWRGVGFFTLQAKRQGLCLQGATAVVGVHSPTSWAIEGMHELPTHQDTVALDLMERRSVEFADVVWSPSRYMLTWLEREQWRLPRRVMVRPYLLPLEEWSPVSPRGPRRVPVREIVFFGRLETRKGLDVFCRAVALLHAEGGLGTTTITLLGKVASVAGEPSNSYLERMLGSRGIGYTVVDGLARDEALAYLSEPGRLAVMPSRLDNYPFTVLECVARGLPFLASDIGGIPEELHEGDRDEALFELRPRALATRLADVLRRGALVARPSFDLPRALGAWADWHRREAARPRRAAVARRTPLVTVCVTHHNRPQYLRQALASIEKQDYDAMEVVLVDTSTQPAARAAVERLVPRLAERGGRVVFAEDRYVGASRNTAARHARGKYVLFMDDDNVAKPDEVSTLVGAAETSGADVVACFLDAFTGDTPPRSEAGALRRWPFFGGSSAMALLKNVIGDTNCLVRRTAFLEAGGFTEDEQVGFEDWEMLGRLLRAGLRIEVVPEALVWFRVTDQGMASRHSGRADHIRALRPFLDLYPGEARILLKYAKHLSLAAAQPLRMPARPATPVDARKVSTIAIFGSGEAGRRVSELAKAAGWRVACVVSNDQAAWHRPTSWCTVEPPASLKEHDVDLVVVASIAGRDAITSQVIRGRLAPRRKVAYFLAAFDTGTLLLQVSV